MTDQRPDDRHRPEANPSAAPPETPETALAAPPSAGYAAPPSAQPAPARAAVAGWYTDPSDSTKHRYWDGAQWTAGQASTQAPAKGRGLSRKAVAGILASVVTLVVGGIAAIALVVPRLEDAATAALNADPNARALEGEERTGWSATPVMGGAGTIKFDPAWGNVEEYVDGQAMEADMAARGVVGASFDGAWLIDGDLEADSTVMIVISVPDVGGASSARLEAQSFIANLTFDIEGTKILAEGPVVTGGGYSGYVAEYEFPLYGDTWPNAVGVVVEGSSQVLAYTLGSATTGSGIEAVESALDSLALN
ncbi:DUF2510 domain-containing protein [Demequina aestuarii]|uniref:DUF2510 domain-containing protein n=1 Tax=Demequina aestuarii TaxID=327095 RepID=UPI000783A21F|nr:DUF2510 domain-containing protein [Demequina aestuarii]